MEAESRMLLARGSGEKKGWELLFSGDRILDCNDEKHLEIDGSDGCTTMCTHLMLRNYLFKNG